jgi:acetylornithine deacetylase
METALVTAEQMKQAVAALAPWAQDRLMQLVQCPSLQGCERGVQDAVHAILQDELGMQMDRWRVDVDALRSLPGFSPVDWDYSQADCVVGSYPQAQPGARSLIINGHIDVVPVDPAHLWTRQPFDAYVKDGWLYGRGSGDMKGGIVAAMTALKALRQLGYRPAGRLHFQTVPEEENSGNGALSCCARGYTAEACLIPEPFGETATTAQPGVMWMTVLLDGKPAHVLDTTAGCSAIEGAYAIFQTLKEMEKTMNETKHNAFANVARPMNYNLGTINGGNWPSSVASFCKFQVRASVYPGADMAASRAALERVVLERAKELGLVAKVEWIGFQAEGFVADASKPLFSELIQSFSDATGRQLSLAPVTATTDARFFHLYYGMPVTCMGPQAQRIHGIDECVSLQSVTDVAITYALFIQRWCGLVRV